MSSRLGRETAIAANGFNPSKAADFLSFFLLLTASFRCNLAINGNPPSFLAKGLYDITRCLLLSVVKQSDLVV